MEIYKSLRALPDGPLNRILRFNSIAYASKVSICRKPKIEIHNDGVYDLTINGSIADSYESSGVWRDGWRQAFFLSYNFHSKSGSVTLKEWSGRNGEYDYREIALAELDPEKFRFQFYEDTGKLGLYLPQDIVKSIVGAVSPVSRLEFHAWKSIVELFEY